MVKKDHQKGNQKVQEVLQLLIKQAPLTVKQEKFCNNACVERFLKAKGDNAKKAAKQLRACLSWRDSIGTDNLMADEFSAELAEGVAYVAGHDHESHPVVIFRIKQDYHKLHSQKQFTRFLVFTLEVAISTMTKNVEQFALLFDASLFRSASAFMRYLLAALKLVGEYYPGRLYNAFFIDPPPLFSYLWKGVKPFVELSSLTTIVSSLDYEESLEFNDISFYPRTASLRYDPSSIKSTPKIGSCSSSRFSFTVSHHFDSLKPWYLSFTDTSAFKVSPTSPYSRGPQISPLNARSYSFASPAARTPSSHGNLTCQRPKRKSLFPSTPLPQRTTEKVKVAQPRTPRPSFLQSPAFFFKKECQVSKSSPRECFMSLLKIYRRPYDELTYRSKMKPPLGGIISIVSPHIKRRQVSLSQRF